MNAPMYITKNVQSRYQQEYDYRIHQKHLNDIRRKKTGQQLDWSGSTVPVHEGEAVIVSQPAKKQSTRQSRASQDRKGTHGNKENEVAVYISGERHGSKVRTRTANASSSISSPDDSLMNLLHKKGQVSDNLRRMNNAKIKEENQLLVKRLVECISRNETIIKEKKEKEIQQYLKLRKHLSKLNSYQAEPPTKPTYPTRSDAETDTDVANDRKQQQQQQQQQPIQRQLDTNSSSNQRSTSLQRRKVAKATSSLSSHMTEDNKDLPRDIYSYSNTVDADNLTHQNSHKQRSVSSIANSNSNREGLESTKRDSLYGTKSRDSSSRSVAAESLDLTSTRRSRMSSIPLHPMISKSQQHAGYSTRNQSTDYSSTRNQIDEHQLYLDQLDENIQQQQQLEIDRQQREFSLKKKQLESKLQRQQEQEQELQRQRLEFEAQQKQWEEESQHKKLQLQQQEQLSLQKQYLELQRHQLEKQLQEFEIQKQVQQYENQRLLDELKQAHVASSKKQPSLVPEERFQRDPLKMVTSEVTNLSKRNLGMFMGSSPRQQAPHFQCPSWGTTAFKSSDVMSPSPTSHQSGQMSTKSSKAQPLPIKSTLSENISQLRSFAKYSSSPSATLQSTNLLYGGNETIPEESPTNRRDNTQRRHSHHHNPLSNFISLDAPLSNIKREKTIGSNRAAIAPIAAEEPTFNSILPLTKLPAPFSSLR